jgi:hypothetical protein
VWFLLLLRRIETLMGTLKFIEGFPDDATVEKVFEDLDFQRGVQAFLTAMSAASPAAMRRGLLEFGPANQTVILWESWMNACSL